MSYRMTDLDLTVVDIEDETYKISMPGSVEGLVKSIQYVGLINPPTLLKKPDRHIIVAGFRRVAAMQQLRFLQIPAKVMPGECSALECIRIAVTDNISQRKLDLLETSRALALLSECLNDGERLSAEAQNLGLPGNRDHIKKMVGLCRLPHMIQTGIQQNRISLNMAIELGGFDESVRNLLARLFMELKFNHNKQKEVCSHLKEITHREKCSATHVLSSEGFSEVLADTELDNLQKTSLVRTKLRRRRYPNLSLAEERFQHNLRKLNLGDRIRIRHPEYFEEMSLKLSMSVKNETELKEQIQILTKTLTNPHLRKIFHSS